MQGIGGGGGSDAHFDESCNRIDTDLMATEQVLIEHGMPHQPTTPLPRQGEVGGDVFVEKGFCVAFGASLRYSTTLVQASPREPRSVLGHVQLRSVTTIAPLGIPTFLVTR